MKTLLLMRHGHAEDYASGGDFERALSSKGTRQCTLTADHARNYTPQSLYVSQAKRTMMSADIVCKALKDVVRHDEASLYLASVADMLAFCAALPNEHDSVMLIGHNPGIYELLGLLHNGEPLSFAMKPATLGVLRCNITSWNSITPHCATLDDAFIPKAKA